MTIVTDNQAELLAWAEEHSSSLYRSDAKAIGRLRNGDISVVVVYDTFSKAGCCMHIASDNSRRWATRSFLAEVFYYPFVTCDFLRVTGLVPVRNRQALSFDKKLGFQFEGVMRNADVDDDIVVLGMLRSECIFIPKEYRHV